MLEKLIDASEIFPMPVAKHMKGSRLESFARPFLNGEQPFYSQLELQFQPERSRAVPTTVTLVSSKGIAEIQLQTWVSSVPIGAKAVTLETVRFMPRGEIGKVQLSMHENTPDNIKYLDEEPTFTGAGLSLYCFSTQRDVSLASANWLSEDPTQQRRYCVGKLTEVIQRYIE